MFYKDIKEWYNISLNSFIEFLYVIYEHECRTST